MRKLVRRSKHWIGLLFITDAVYLFITWLIRHEAVKYMSLFILLYTVMVVLAGMYAEYCCQKRDAGALLGFLNTPDDRAKENFLMRFGGSRAARMLCSQYLLEQSLVNERTVELEEYREYIEAWVHEAKTPLSLLTLLLNNHSETMTPYVNARLHYIEHCLNEDVERILYYARLQGGNSDVKFTRFRLDECVEEAVSEYQAFIKERGIALSMDLSGAEVVSDRKVVLFLISQLISNAVKYADSIEGRISISMYGDGDEIHLGIYNNGDGVPPEDLPFIFDKGFTGNYPNRQKATGMGLYLVRKYAQKLCVQARPDSRLPYGQGFGIELVFKL